jgi:hypothetical protein
MAKTIKLSRRGRSERKMIKNLLLTDKKKLRRYSP